MSRFLENVEDLNTRLSAIEAGQVSTNRVVISNGSIHSNNYFDSLEGVIRYQARSGLRITTAVVSKVGATNLSETLEIDLKTSETVNGTYESIMTTRPSIAGSASADSSTNAAFSDNVITENHWLRVDITSTISNISEIHILIAAEVT